VCGTKCCNFVYLIWECCIGDLCVSVFILIGLKIEQFFTCILFLIMLFVYYLKNHTELEFQWSFHNQSLESRAAYWSEVAWFKQSVICGLIWYIQVSLLHSGHLPDNKSTDCMKAPQPLMPFVYSEAVHLFNMFYQVKSCPEFVVLDCALYPCLNGYRGQIQSFNLQNGQYILAVNRTQFNPPSSPSSFVMQLCPHYMEPLVKVKKFGITNSGTLQSKQIVSLPIMFLSSDTTTPTITIKFYWKLFELMRKRYIRPEKTTNNQSSNTLHVKLTKMDDEDVLKDQ
jgi:hypothetical protein